MEAQALTPDPENLSKEEWTEAMAKIRIIVEAIDEILVLQYEECPKFDLPGDLSIVAYMEEQLKNLKKQ